MSLAPKAPFQGPSGLARKSRRLHPVEHLRESRVLLEHLQIADMLTARQVQQNQGHHHLRVGPTLLALSQLQMATDGFHQPGHPGQIQEQRQPGQSRHSCLLFLGFVLVGKQCLCYQFFTSLVFEQPLRTRLF